ncbi:MAG: MG2 domain-containing protein [Sulfurovum sp.]|nr:MG2 domain-containing protein [Sulfurovum sp.]
MLAGKNGLQAKAIYAYGKDNDFSVIDLSKPAHDLSDRGVEGRESVGEYSAFVYSNRDIFRPSERVTFHALLRDHQGKAQAGLPLSVKVFDARGVEVSSKQMSSDSLGHLSDSLTLSASATTGKWRVAMYAGDKEAIGSMTFLVEDFIPPKIKVEVQKHFSHINPKEKVELNLQSKYLNGEVFPKARVEVSAILHKSKYLEKVHEGYYFGNIKKYFGNEYLDTLIYETNSEGQLSLPLSIDKVFNTSFPLSVHIDIAVSELGGRPIHYTLEAPYNNREHYIGLKPLFANDAVDMQSKPQFEVIYLDKHTLSKETLSYALIEEETRWHWRSTTDSWEYYKTYHDGGIIQRVSSNTLSDKGLSLSLDTLDWGSYRARNL